MIQRAWAASHKKTTARREQEVGEARHPITSAVDMGMAGYNHYFCTRTALSPDLGGAKARASEDTPDVNRGLIQKQKPYQASTQERMGPRIRGALIEDAKQEVIFLRNTFASIGTRCRSILVVIVAQ